MRPWSIGRF